MRKLTIKCYENSYAQHYAEENGIKYLLIDEERLVGDINNDGKIDVNDVTELQKHLAGHTKADDTPIITDSDLNIADITNDGIIDLRDVTALQLSLSE